MIQSSSSIPNNCGDPTTTNCIQWQGDNLTCLGITKGQWLTDVVANIATAVCDLQSQLDLSDLDLKCLFDLCISCPQPTKTLGVVLELLVNKVCVLDEAVKAITTATTSGSDPVLRLADCFQYKDINGDLIIELPHSQYTKQIAVAICAVKLSLSSVEDDISGLHTSLNALQLQVNQIATTIPDVTSSCLFTGIRSISDAWDLIDAAFCQLRGALGPTTDMNLAISRQCDNLNAGYASVNGWNLSPSNLAQSINNMWLVLCDLRDRITSIENTCCAPSCDKVLIGFSASLSSTGDGLLIRFTSGNGTSIPSGFTDLGSVLTITDEDGNVDDFAVSIANNTSDILTFTSVKATGKLNVNLDARLGNGALICEKCVNKVVTLDGQCKFCEITATGGPGTSVTIIYEDNGGVLVNHSFTVPSTTTTTTLP